MLRLGDIFCNSTTSDKLNNPSSQDPSGTPGEGSPYQSSPDAALCSCATRASRKRLNLSSARAARSLAWVTCSCGASLEWMQNSKNAAAARLCRIPVYMRSVVAFGYK